MYISKRKPLKRHRSIYCTPLVHKNILGTLRFDKQQHFIIKKVTHTPTQQMKSVTHTWRIENSVFLFFNSEIVQLELIGPLTKASLFNAQHHTVL